MRWSLIVDSIAYILDEDAKIKNDREMHTSHGIQSLFISIILEPMTVTSSRGVEILPPAAASKCLLESQTS
jgi:hypothetical protein